MQPSVPTPPAAPAGQATATVAAPAPGGPYTAREMYEAAQVQRRILRDQLAAAESDREDIAQQLRQPEATGVDRQGLEQQLRLLDARVLDLRQQLADAQLREAQAAAVPGSTSKTRQEVSNERFEVMMVGGVTLALVLGLPLVIAFSRRLWKKTAVTVSLTPDLDRRLDAIDRTLESTALEVERIGEGQRFVTQLLANRAVQETAKALPPDAR